MVMSLYPVTQKNPKLAANVVKMLDMGMGGQEGVAEAVAPSQYAKLYHSTPLHSLDAILQSGYLAPTGNPAYLSLTRDSKLDYGSWAGSDSFVEFDIDQNAVRQRIKLEPYNHSATMGGPRATGGGESEERTKQKIPLKGFVTAMHVPTGWEGDKAGEHYGNLLKKYGVPIVYDIVPKLEEQGVAEGLDEAVGDNYLYHATQPSGMMRILRSGAIKASYRPQEATKARTQSPTVSTTRSKQYAESDDFVNFLNLTKEGNSVIIVFDRNAVANHYKMFSTSQGTQTVGDEFEEVIVVPKGAMPIQGTMKGFYFNPKRTAEIEEFNDTPWFKELLNSPYYMGQKQGVAEGAPIVVAQAPIDVRNPKKAPQPYRNKGDIVPDTKPPSTEKRGVKGRPGQRPMPAYESAGLSVEQLAHISDKALDDAYHYGRSTPGANFGWMANLQSAKAAKKLIDAGETDIEAISDAIHKGWNITAAADYKGQLQLDTPTPEEKKLKRAKLAMQSYSQLPEEEKEKDRVVARAMLAALGKTNVSESTDYLDEK
jgi:hypothetical protein